MNSLRRILSTPHCRIRILKFCTTPQLDGLDNTLIITNSCAKRILQLRESSKNPGLMLRIAVEGGGCSGFQYTFETTNEKNEEDL